MNHQLAMRPSAAELAEQGILKGSKVAAGAERLQRRRASDALNHHLASRPDPQQLQRILKTTPGGVAAKIVEAQEHLARQLNQQSLDHLLATVPTRRRCSRVDPPRAARRVGGAGREAGGVGKVDAPRQCRPPPRHRPSAADLEATGILHAPPGVSPALVASQEALEKQLLRDAMNHQLATRPPPEALQQQGILKSQPGVSAKIAADAERLQRRRASDALKASLAARPSPVKLMQEGILRDPSGGREPARSFSGAFDGI